MVDFNNLMDLQFEIFILMIIGYILRKTNIISKEHRKSLTDLVIYIVLPANIIYSFMIKMDTQIMAKVQNIPKLVAPLNWFTLRSILKKALR